MIITHSADTAKHENIVFKASVDFNTVMREYMPTTFILDAFFHLFQCNRSFWVPPANSSTWCYVYCQKLLLLSLSFRTRSIVRLRSSRWIWWWMCRHCLATLSRNKKKRSSWTDNILIAYKCRILVSHKIKWNYAMAFHFAAGKKNA